LAAAPRRLWPVDNPAPPLAHKAEEFGADIDVITLDQRGGSRGGSRGGRDSTRRITRFKIVMTE